MLIWNLTEADFFMLFCKKKFSGSMSLFKWIDEEKAISYMREYVGKASLMAALKHWLKIPDIWKEI